MKIAIFFRAYWILLVSVSAAADITRVTATRSTGLAVKRNLGNYKRFGFPKCSSRQRTNNMIPKQITYQGIGSRLHDSEELRHLIVLNRNALDINGGGGKAVIGNDTNTQLLEFLKSPAVAFHIVFAICAVAGLALPIGQVGVRILVLVLGYNIALFTVASKNGYKRWLDIHQLLIPLSFLVVFADWFQIIYQDILVYPDIGGPRIGPVSGFMAGLWTIPLFLLILLGNHFETSKPGKETPKNKAVGFAAVGLASLVLFALAEGNSWRIPMWETKNCRQLGGRMAYFCVLAEVVLALATYDASSRLMGAPFLTKCIEAVVLLFLYVGACAMFYLIIDVIPDGIACRALAKICFFDFGGGLGPKCLVSALIAPATVQMSYQVP